MLLNHKKGASENRSKENDKSIDVRPAGSHPTQFEKREKKPQIQDQKRSK